MGLLDKFNRGVNAIETGLLGNATAYNPALSQYLSPGTLQKANSDARMQLGLAMLAASESGMGLGQGLMMAQQMAGQAFQQPLEGDLRATMTADAMRRVQAQKEQQTALSGLEQQISPQLQPVWKAMSDENKQEILMKTLMPAEQGGTDDMKEYQLAVQQGFQGTFVDYMVAMKAAGRTQVTTEVNLPPAESELAKSLGKARGEQFAAAHTAAKGAVSTLEQLNLLEPLVNSPGFISGPFGETRLQVAKVLGLQGAEETQAYFAAVGRQVGENIKMFGAGTGLSDADREFAKQMAAGSIDLTPDAIKRIMRINRQVSEGVIKSYNEDREFLGGKPGREAVLDMYPALVAPGAITIKRIK